MILCGGALWGGACRTPSPDDTAATVQVDLADDHLLSLSMSYSVGQSSLIAGAEGVVDWADLTLDTHGRAVGAAEDVASLVLVRLSDPDVDSALAELARGALSQQVVSLQVSCLATSTSCQISEAGYDSGHPIDMADVFVEGSGPWLAWLDPVDSSEPMALVELVPSADGPDRLTLPPQVGSLDATLESPSSLLPLPAGAHLDWSGLTTTSQGVTLLPQRLDRVVLARVASDTPAADRVLRLAEVAQEVWSGEVDGEMGISLDALQDPQGQPFDQGLTGAGDWLLALSCSTCTAPQPAVLVAVSPP